MSPSTIKAPVVIPRDKWEEYMQRLDTVAHDAIPRAKRRAYIHGLIVGWLSGVVGSAIGDHLA